MLVSATINSVFPVPTAAKEGGMARADRSGEDTVAGSAGSNQHNRETTSLEGRELQQLKQRDREVKAHEQAHMAAAADLVTRGANYTYDVWPDGKRYAVGGEVSIDTSPVPGDPQATQEKARRIREAALAPAEPSSQDRAVASKAAQMAMQARIEILRQKQDDSSSANSIDGARMVEAYKAQGEAVGGEYSLIA